MKYKMVTSWILKPSFLMFLVAPGLLFAQNVEKEETRITIKITEDQNGKTKEIERVYTVPPLNEADRQEFVKKVLDSLKVDGKRQMISITADDETFVRVDKGDKKGGEKRDRKAVADNRETYRYDFKFDSDDMKRHLRNFERELKPRAEEFAREMEGWGDRMGDFWNREVGKPANIKGLSVFTNKPNNGMLNVRFVVPLKGDVSISVKDTKGKEVGKKELKDFQGEFVGQVELKKNAVGTLFVTVVQGEDGTVKRVTLP